MTKSGDASEAPGNKSGKEPNTPKNVGRDEFLFSPRFRSVAAMAGWDEEALMVAAFVVEDTPERLLKSKKRSDTHGQRTPPSDSRRKRRAQGRSSVPISVSVIHLDEDKPEPKQELEDRNEKTGSIGETKNLPGKGGDVEVNLNKRVDAPAIPCIDRLREELSCAICLEICYEPSTTPCGHSFCRKCLHSAADKCGKKCPKCRNLISNGRYCTVNTVLWNTIQLLFPQEVEARKASTLASDANEKAPSPPRVTRSRFIASLSSPGQESSGEERRLHRRIRRQTTAAVRSRVRTELPDQDEDAALAFRLQREEFLEAFRERGASDHRATRVARRA